MKLRILLSTAYFPPVQYVTKALAGKVLVIEKHEHYSKQSYRNRCNISGANGTQLLSVPVKKSHQQKNSVCEVLIDYDTPWQKTHWRAIESAYGKSPFFLYYKDDLEPFFNKEFTHLFDFNNRIFDCVKQLIGLNTEILFTDNYVADPDDSEDLREIIHPKVAINTDPYFIPVPYYQVFATKHGFLPNLSILDLIFNEGPQALPILMLCYTGPAI